MGGRDSQGFVPMLVLFEFEGRDFVVRATSFGKNGYHHGKVLYADPARAVAEKEVTVPIAAIPPPEVKKSAVAGSTLARARRNKSLELWDPKAKEFWLWLKEKKMRQGLISPMYSNFCKHTGKRIDHTAAFFVAAAGERHDMWKITANAANTRFTMTVVD
jgi:hypothetical protein